MSVIEMDQNQFDRTAAQPALHCAQLEMSKKLRNALTYVDPMTSLSRSERFERAKMKSIRNILQG